MRYLTYLIILTAIITLSCKNSKDNFHQVSENAVTSQDDLIIVTVKEGSGQEAGEGQEVLIYETTTYSDGQLIYTTKGMDRPLKFLIGGSQVIEGVDLGVRGMKVGEIRKLIVPPSLSKREFYPDIISPDSTLYYEIELVGIEK